ncbi:MAG: fumarate hydratase [Candidatus Omnitrophota bacterium]
MTLRRVKIEDIERTVEDLCIKANTVLREDVVTALEEAFNNEKKGSLSQKMMKILLENAVLSEKETIPICQDTGIVNVFLEIGEDVKIEGKGIKEAVNRGVEKAYKEKFFRKSVVLDPVIRKNTGTNTPAVIHIDIVEGDSLKIFVMPKGFGSENKGRIKMMDPTCTSEEIIKFCVDVIKDAGPDACPPYVIGIGIGGTMEKCAYMAKRVLLLPLSEKNPKAHMAELEERIKKEINDLKIGTMGVGGESTVLAVKIMDGPTHIAGCPVAVNVSCHALRSASAEL